MSSKNVQSQSNQNTKDEETLPALRQSVVNRWMDLMNKGVLSCTHFKEHWRVWVPRLYSPEPKGSCHNWDAEEKKAQMLFYDTLEWFICNGDPQVVLKQLNQMDSPPSMCGRVFKIGMPTYSCRECGVDPTCVLCTDCFKQSVHRNHKYRMGTSTGGGCCDCGDPEAWKKDPFCKIHLPATQSKESRGNKLPGDIAERAVVTFEAVLQYCYELLSLEHSPGVPADLCVKETSDDPFSLLPTPDTYCIVLYNDESHTFDQVIHILTRVIRCSQKEAREFVTIVDREGRAVVKCSGFQYCTQVKSEIENHASKQSNRLLRVQVVHSHVIAHQTFAIKLLNWLQEFVILGEGFRILFSNVALNTKLPEISIVEAILMGDWQLWKSARTAWHRLFISGMLMEYESKKALAIVFTYNYGSVMKDFIRDDHDQMFSITSLSVQLFTVPTLAHHLIAHHDVLFILLNTFISESSRRCNAAGKLEFERNAPNTSFKRALCILGDLKYLLSVKPDVWTDELRRGFLQGISLLLTLFCSMQCMDAVLRQVSQHLEYEPEWESAVSLHMRLSPVISLALEWCGSDRIVLIKAFRLVLRKLYEQPGTDNGPGVVRELADHSTTCIQYDVSSEPVSIHLPLSRFLAGLFLYFEKHNLHFQCSEFINQTKPTPEQIIEPVLTAQAMIAQVHAGMWRRNGYSLLNQLFFYHNVKCRSEMLDKDIVLLQAGASLIESNEFLIHVLNKFNLLNWAHPDFEANTLKNPEEDSIRETVNLMEEFLELLITIIGERYMPGVGQVTADDRLKKEIIQQLCIKPLSHSELSKTLTDDLHSEVVMQMERVIHDVADFKKPSQSTGKGVYELKPHLYSEYNVFFYHYTKEELSKSEEAQRKRRKALGELECCPPPKLPKLAEVFSLVTNLLQCDVMLHVMQTVLERALNYTARSFSESQVYKVLHLIGYALQEQESGYYPFLAFPERAAKWKIYKLLEELSNSPRMEAHKDLFTWVLMKYREVAGAAVTEVPAVQPASQTEQAGDTESNKTDKEWRTKMAAQKRAKIMAQMAAMQKNFVMKNAKLFEEAALETNKSSDRGSTMDLTESFEQKPIALGKYQTTRMSEDKTYTCILCQEEQVVTVNRPAMVLAAFVQQSTVLCQNRAELEEPDPRYLSAKLGASPHTSTCGHVMHALCWQEYFDNVLAKEKRRPNRLRQPPSFDVEKHEYLCPLCECLSNTVLPVLPPLGALQPSTPSPPDISFATWVDSVRIAAECATAGKEYPPLSVIDDVIPEHSPQCEYCTRSDATTCPIKLFQLVRECRNVAKIFEDIYGQCNTVLAKDVVSMLQLFEQTTYTKEFGAAPSGCESRVPMLVWKTTAYTIHAIEFLLRDMDKPLLGALSSRQRDSLEALARISAVLPSVYTYSTGVKPRWANRDTIKFHACDIVNILFNHTPKQACILEWDAFGVLVPLINSLPSLLMDAPPPIITCGILEFYVLQLVFVALIVRILLTSDFNEGMDVESQEVEDDTSCESLLTLVEALSIDVGNQTVGELWRRVKHACLPFLRCCALYFHYVSDVPAPAELTKTEGCTYENICAYLGLPTTCDDLVKPNSDIIMKLLNTWKSHPTVQAHLSGAHPIAIIKEPLKVNKLVELPEDYSELINTISNFTCPNSDAEVSRNPTLCLVCGKMLCAQAYCCQTELNNIMVGACTYHASQCGTGIGMFLRVRECEILFLRSPNRGSFDSPPYLDTYGETDQGLRRGNPLRLCHDKYKQLNQMWLGHGLHENVTRAIETSTNLMSTQWHHL